MGARADGMGVHIDRGIVLEAWRQNSSPRYRDFSPCIARAECRLEEGTIVSVAGPAVGSVPDAVIAALELALDRRGRIAAGNRPPEGPGG